MKGLLVKDICIAKKVQGKVFLALVLLSVVMSFLSENSFFAVGYLVFVSAIFAINSIAYDEWNGGYSYLFTLPISVKQYVISKYVFAFVMVGIALACSFLVSSCAFLVKGQGENIVLYIAPTLVVGIVACLYIALLIPIQLLFGAEKSRMVIFGITGLLVLCGMAFSRLRILSDLRKTSVVQWWIEIGPWGWAILLFGGACILIGISYLSALHIMKRKEF